MSHKANNNLELEIKILDVDVEHTKSDLVRMGAKCIFDGLQRLFVYDFYPLNSTYHSIVWTLNTSSSHKEKELSLKKLRQLLGEVDDLLSFKDRKIVESICKSDGLKVLATKISETTNEVMLILNNEEFINVITKYSTNPNRWVRLRADDHQATLSVKHIFDRKVLNSTREHSIDRVKEVEINVSDFDMAKLLLEELGFFHKNYQEKKRTSYILENGVKVDIDQWPLIPAYIEIEGNNQDSIYKVVESLGYKKEDAKIMNTDDVYALYNIDMYDYPELTFG